LKNGVTYSITVAAVTQAGNTVPSEAIEVTPTNGMDGEVSRLVVEYEEGVAPTTAPKVATGDDLIEDIALKPGRELGDGLRTVVLSEPVSLKEGQAIADKLTADPRVVSAEPDLVVTSAAFPETPPNDASYGAKQWNLWDAYGIGAGRSADTMTTAYAKSQGRGIKVGVIDTGITAHADLGNRLLPGYDFVSNYLALAAAREDGKKPVSFDGDYVDAATYGDTGWDNNPADPGDWRGVAPVRNSSWHGTNIAGVIGAEANNDKGIVGVAPKVLIQPIRALSWRGGLLSDVAAAIVWASGGSVPNVPDNPNPVNVINLSFSTVGLCTPALQTAIDGANERGVTVIAAAGNANDEVSNYAPANCDNVITVGASDRSGKRAVYSNYGAGVDVSAPGGDINAAGDTGVYTLSNTGTSTPAEDGYAYRQGTSIAAAHVTAAVARLLDLDPSQTPSLIRYKITGNDSVKHFASDACDTDPLKTCGSGIVQIASSSLVNRFDYTGTTQTWIVPAGVTSVYVEAVGANGGLGSGASRGGARVQGTLAVTPGETLAINVGGGGAGGASGAAGGWNGGGNGQGTYGGGGGGATDLRQSGSAVVNRVIVAGGGGGGGLYGGGGNAAYPAGVAGALCSSTWTACVNNSAGGTQSTGGANGTGANTAGTNAGGGGGGYFGGGAGATNAGGGGGSSYTASAVTAVTHTALANTANSANGYLTITTTVASLAPTDLAGFGYSRSVDLAWTPWNFDAVAGYRIKWGTTSGALVNSFDVLGRVSNSYRHTGQVFQVTSKSVTSNVATLTTSTPHGLTSGQRVNVSGVGGVFDGTFTVVAAPTATTFTYAVTSANLASSAVTPAGQVEQDVNLSYNTAYYYQIAALYSDASLPCNTACVSDYSAEISATPVFTKTTSFQYTGAAQTYTVPAGVTNIRVDAYGAAGGASANGPAGGKGGRIQGTVPVTTGEVLNIYVGGAGPPYSSTGGGWNGGGNGQNSWGGGGGGAVDIRRGGTALSNRIIVAGGGGGGGYHMAGGDAGGLSGAASVYAGVTSAPGTQTTGNALGIGAAGTTVNTGGGGGGYWGGGSGAANGIGGGGGSSWASSNLRAVIHSPGYQLATGDGRLNITVQMTGAMSVPTALTAAPFQRSVDLSWVAPEEDSTTGYRIKWGTDPAALTNQVDVNTNQTNFRHQSLSPYAVSTKALTTNVATLTTSAAHNLVVGDSVVVEGVGAPFDGIFKITAVPTTTTFKYAVTATNVVSSPVAPTGLVQKELSLPIGTTFYYKIASRYTDLTQSCGTSCFSPFSAPVVSSTTVFSKSTSFDYNGSPQAYTVPAGVTWLQVDASGAAGATAANLGVAGLGGRIRATIPVTSGETLFVYPGREGGPVTAWNGLVTGNSWDAGWNGGGVGYGNTNGGGGGGATDIRRGISVTNTALTSNVATVTTSAAHGFTVGSQVIVGGVGAPFDGVYPVTGVPTTTTFTYVRSATNIASASASGAVASADPLNAASLNRRIVVAGGGGGGSYYAPGGAGGGLIGGSSVWSSTISTGGSQTAGGGFGYGTSAAAIGQSGGGGGGYWGGTTNTAGNVGGGGGSSWTSAAVLSNSDPRTVAGITHWQGVRTGNGRLVITSPLSSSLSIPGNVSGIGTQRRANLNWTPVDTDAVTGYRVLWGTSTGALTNSFDVMDPLANGAVHTSNTVSAITNKALTSNVATLTTSTPHGLVVGSNVLVQGVDQTFDGSYIVTAVTSTTFSYAKISANVVSQVSVGIAQTNDSLTFGRTYYYQVAAIYTDLNQSCATRCLSDVSAEFSVLIRFTTTSNYDYTGVPQTYTVPAGVSWLSVDAQGAQGSVATNLGSPGLGGRIQSTIPVNAGETLFVFTGRAGGIVTNYDASVSGNSWDAGWNGGGVGYGNANGGGGGGASDIRRGVSITTAALTSNVATLTTSSAHGFSVGNQIIVGGVEATYDGVYTVTAVPTSTTFTYSKTAANIASATVTGAVTSTNPINAASLNRRVIVAGGGGGGSYFAPGGAGGGLVGGNSVWSSTISYGGSQTTGHSLGQGTSAAAIGNAGGGGGGYWGGGTNPSGNVGGAGGSSWVSPIGATTVDTRSAVGTMHTQGARSGDGFVAISIPMAGSMPVPTNGAATGQLGQVALNWTPSIVDAATGYRVQWGTSLGSLTNQFDVSGKSTASYVHTGLTVGTTYYYQIATKYTDLSQSCLTNCVSAFSNVFYATPVFTADTVFDYTGAPQSYKVPVGVTWLQVDAQGGAGATAANSGTGGKGGRVSATIPVNSGETLFVFTGRGAGDITNYDNSVTGNVWDAGWNGGGVGYGNANGGGGGGASDIRRGISVVTAALTSNVATLTTSTAHGFSVGNQIIVGGVGSPFDGIYTITTVPTATTLTYARTSANVSSGVVSGALTSTDPINASSLNRRVIVAGGGGGGSYYAPGGAGGGLTGGNSQWSSTISYGGSQTNGHALGQGRSAAALGNSGGGGGGYWGGTTNLSGNVGGAGGSSWTATDGPSVGDNRTASGIVHVQGVRSGNGVVTIGIPTRAYPTGVTAIGLQGFNTLGWDDSDATGITSYKVYGGTSPDPTTLLATLSPDTLSFVDGGTPIAVTNKALTSNIATLTTASPHGLTVGKNVRVQGVDGTFNGWATVTAVTSTTFSYARVAANVASTAVTTGVFTSPATLSIGTTYYYRVSFVANGIESQRSFEVRATPVYTTDRSFGYTGAPETFVVPDGVTTLRADVSGGEGATAAYLGTSGKGGRIIATLQVTPGEALFVFAGQAGGSVNSWTAGWNGGGVGYGNANGGGGGGASDIRHGIALTNRSLTSNVATLTTGSAHGLAVGNQIIVGGVDSIFDGVYTITSVPSPTTLTYARTAANIASTTASGAIAPTDPLNSASLARRIIVAGGGGGGSYFAPGGAGGGLIGGSSQWSSTISYGGTQSNGYAIGYGRSAAALGNSGGGGGGYWGGTTAVSGNVGGGGGSSWTSDEASPIQNYQGIVSGNGTVLLSIPYSTASSGLAADAGDSQVNVTWSSSSATDLSGYALYGGTSPAALTMIATVAPTVRSYLHRGSSLAVTNKALTSNVATLTTSSAHGFTVGQSVTVSNVDAVFNGTFTITAVTSTTFSYAKTNANVTSASSLGSASLTNGLTNGTAYYYKLAPLLSLNQVNVVGPLSSAVTATPSAPSLDTYAYTGAPVEFTVPAGVLTLGVDAQGGKGGTAGVGQGNFQGGLGGRVQANIPVMPGEKLYLYVGGAGATNAGGWNGGGTGANANVGGGGGASDVRRNSFTITTKSLTSNTATLTTSVAHGFSVGAQVVVAGVDATFNGNYTITAVPSTTTFSFTKSAANVISGSASGTVRGPSAFNNAASLTSRLVVAGGGGGAGGYYANTGSAGGAGGGLTAGSVTYGAYTAAGATQSTGNALGIGANAISTTYSGAAGGGYWGGQVAPSGAQNVGGGGGSSWTAVDATSVTHTQAYRTGAGQILLNYRADLTAPTVVDVTSTAANGAYLAGANIPVLVNFTEPVYVTGTPQLTLALGAGSARSTVVLNYFSGSGTSSLVFTYAVAAGDLTPDLDFESTSALSLNGGSIQDLPGNAATLTLAAPGSGSSLAGTSALYIDADKPATPTLLVADGVDSIMLDWSNNTESDLKEYRVYSCSSLSAATCSTTSTFSTLSSVAAPASSFEHFAVGRGIRYYYYVTSVDTRGNESGPSSIVSWVLPIPSVITTPSVATATPTQDLTPTVTGAGDPGTTVTVYIDGIAQSPTVVIDGSGNYTFTPATDLTPGEHVFTAKATLIVNGKPNSSGMSMGWTTLIDTTAPRLSSITRSIPNVATTSADVLTFRATFSEAVTGVAIGDFAVVGSTATVTSVTPVSGSVGTYSLTVSGGDLGNLNGTVGISLVSSPTVADLASNALANLAVVGATETYTLDNNFPFATITSSALSINGLQTPTLTFTLNKPATDFNLYDISATTGAVSNFAAVSSTVYTAKYTPRTGFSGVATVSVDGGGFTDAGGLANSGTSLAITIDTTPPAVSSLNSITANGYYNVGANVDVVVNFDEAVTVATGGGVPYVTLETGTTDRNATYLSGSGTSAITFRYTVVAGDDTGDLDALSTTALATNGGTIRDAAGNNAVLTLPAPGAAGSLGANKAIVVDTVAPTAPTALALTPVGGTVVANTLLANNTNMTATATIIAGQATGGSAKLYIGATQIASDVSIASGDTTVSFDLGKTSAAQLQAAIAASGSVTVKLLDAAGNISSASTAVTLIVDYIVPTVTLTSDKTSLVAGQTATITATLSEPSANFTSADLVAAGGVLSGFSGSGTTYTATFTPTSASTTAGGINVAIGAFSDAAGNTNAAASNSLAIAIDTVIPTVTSLTASPSTGTYRTGSTIDITVNFSEVVDVVTGGGTPTLLLATNAAGSNAVYVSGSGTNALVFRYTVAAGDDSADLNHKSTTALAVNGGSIKDQAGNSATLTLPAVTAGATGALATNAAIVIDTTAPSAPINVVVTPVGGAVVSNSLLAANTNMTATATITAGQATDGSAQLFLGSTILATDSTISSTDTTVSFDLGTASATALQAAVASGGQITVKLVDKAGNISTASTPITLLVDYVVPTVAIAASRTSFLSGESATVTFTLSDSTTGFTASDVTVTGGGITGFSGSGTSYTATYTPAAGGGATGPGAVAGSIQVVAGAFTDTAGNPSAASSTIATSFDIWRPTVASFTSTTPDGAYRDGASINIKAVMTESVAAGAMIAVTLDTGAVVTLRSATAGTTLSGTYVIALGQASNDLDVVGYTYTPGAVTDTAGNAMTSTALPTGANSLAGSKAISLDTLAPTAATSVALTPVGGTVITNLLNTTNTNLTATASITAGQANGGVAKLLLGTTVLATDSSIGLNDNSISFDLGLSSAAALQAAVAAGGQVTVVLEDSAGNVSSASSAVTLSVDYEKPTATISSDVTARKNGQTATITILTSDTPTGLDNADLTVSAGSAAALTTVSASEYTSVFTPGVSAGGAQTITLRAGAFTDANGNPSVASNTVSIAVDTVAPTVTGATIASNNATSTLAKAGDQITVTLATDENVVVTGTPTIPLTLTSGVVDATYVSGSGTRSLVFKYTVTAGDLDAAGGIGVGALSVGAATLADAAGNSFVATFTAPTNAIVIDTAAPSAPTANAVTTKIANPVITGTAEAGSTVRVYDNSAVPIALLGTVTADGSGNWTLTATGLAEGDHNVTARATDAAGNVSVASTVVLIRVDRTAPAAPTIITFSDDTGSSPTDSITKDTTLTVTGSAEPGSSVTLSNGSSTVGTATADSSGLFTITTPVLSGSVTLSAVATDAVGNTSIASSTRIITIDTTAPVGPTIAGPLTTRLTNPTITGVTEPNAIVTISDGATLLGTTSADSSGAWSYAVTATMADGAHTISATATDIAGNLGSASSYTMTVDATPPALTFDAATGNDDVNYGEKTAGVTLTGTVEAGAAVTLALAGRSATATVSGTSWSYPMTSADWTAIGTTSPVTVVVTAKDAVLNTSTRTRNVAMNLVAAATPGMPALLAADDSGTKGDGITSSRSVRLDVALVTTGLPVHVAGDRLSLVDGSGVELTWVTLTGTDIAAGSHQFTLSGLGDGTYVLSARSYASGNTTTSASALTLKIDNRVPGTPGAPDLVAGSDSGISDTDNLTNVLKPTLRIAINGIQISGSPLVDTDTIELLDNANVVESFAVTSAAISAGYLDVTPSANLAVGNHVLTARAVSATQVSGAASVSLAITIDTAGQGAPGAPDLLASDDTGSSSTDNITATTQPRFLVSLASTGAVTNDVVRVLDGSTVLGSATLTDADVLAGQVTVALSQSLTSGARSLTARIDDRAGNLGAASLSLTVTLNTAVPNAPMPLLASSSDSGTAGDGITNVTTPAIRGTGVEGQLVKLYDGATYIGEAMVTGGVWSITPGSALSDGSHTFTVTATNEAGTLSVPSSALVVLVDSIGPATPGALTFSVDTGVSASDATTSDNDLMISGTVEAGAQVLVTIDGLVVDIVTASASGVWSLASSGVLIDGIHIVAVVARDSAGNSSAARQASVTIDTAAPAAPSVASTSSASSRPSISGLAEAGSTISVYDGPTLLGTAVTNGAGAWSFVPASAMTDGIHAITVKAADPAGNISAASASASVTVDTSAPASPVVTSMRTALLAPTVTGTSDPSTTVKIYSGATLMGSATANGLGAWSTSIGFPAATTYTLTARAFDEVQNQSVLGAAGTIVVDQTGPAAPAISGSPISSNLATPTITGTAEANSTVQLYQGNAVPIGAAVADGAGAWTIVTSSLATATYSLTARATDEVGNAGTLSSAATLIIDVTAPLAPTVAAFTTYSLTPVITGTGEVGATVSVYDGTTLIGTAVVGAGGTWSLTVVSSLGAGAHSVTAKQTDAAGNVGVFSTPARTISAVYSAILAGADGTADGDLALSASQYASIGLSQIDTAAKASLLNGVLDALSNAAVDTSAELNALANTVAGILLTAAGGNPSPALTAEDLAALGITGVTSSNLADVLAAIAATADNGSGVSSLAALQNIVSTTAGALATISGYTGSNTAPSLTDFTNASITGVDASNLAAINSILASLPAGSRNSVAEIQALIDAYNALLTGVDGTSNNNVNLIATQYAALGLTAIDTATEVSLMNRVLDVKTAAGVDTAAELIDIANAVSGIMATAAGLNASPALTPAILASLGIAGVTDANLAAVLGAISGTADDGSGVDTLAEIQALIDQIISSAKAAALAVITGYNGQGTSAPTLADYQNATITGVTSANLAAVNSVIAVATAGQTDSISEVQVIVNTYNLLLAGADGTANSNVALTASQYGVLQVTAIDSAAKASLMNSAVDVQATAGVDSLAELNALAATVVDIFTTAAGGTPAPALTAARLTALGLTGITADNLAAILAAIAATADDGSGVTSLSALQAVVSAAATAAANALVVIAAYDGTNTAPTIATYSAAGISGVSASNLAAINSMIAQLPSSATDTSAEVQAIVDAYNILLNAADGLANGNATLTAAQYQLLGLPVINTNAEALLMNVIVDSGTPTSVDTFAELNTLANIVNGISVTAAGGSASPALTAADFAALGITGVTPANLAAVLASIALTADDGSGVNSIAKIQAIATAAAAQVRSLALAVIAAYDGSNNVPTLDNYSNAEVTGITSGNLAAINSAIAALSSSATDTTLDVQAVVDAYVAVLAAADSLNNDNANLTASQFQALGLSTIDSAVETSLLNDVIDVSGSAAVTPQSKLVAMADAVSGIMATAAGGTASPALTAASFAALGIPGVTSANLSYILAAIAATADNGSGVSTLAALAAVVAQAVADATAAALANISGYTGANSAPNAADFSNAGITGVTSANMAAINSALAALPAAARDSAAEIQALVDAYNLVLAGADGIDNNNVNLTATQYAAMGLTQIDTSAKTGLLNEILDTKTLAQVDTIAEVNAYAQIVADIFITAVGGTPAQPLTITSFTAIGITGVDSTNLALILAAIEATNDDVSGVDTLGEIQALVASVRSTQAAALAVIRDYAGNNTQPVLSTFAAAGVSGVTLANLDGINDYLATMTAAQTDTFAEVQALIDAYNALSPGCDGIDNNNVTLTQDQWHALGYTEVTTAEQVTALNNLFDTEDWLVSGSAPATAAIVADVVERLRPVVRVQPRAAIEPDAGSTEPSRTPTSPQAPVSNATAPSSTLAPVVVRPAPLRPVSIPTATPAYPTAPKPGVGIREVVPGQAVAIVDGQAEQTVIRIIDQSRIQVDLPEDISVRLTSIATGGKPATVGQDGSLLVSSGSFVDIEGAGYKPGTEVDFWIYSTPTHLGTLVADAAGSFTAHFVIPESIAIGSHTVKIDGVSKSGKLTTVSVGVTVVPVNESEGAEVAGGDSLVGGFALSARQAAVIGGITLMFLLVGAGFVFGGRRRRHK